MTASILSLAVQAPSFAGRSYADHQQNDWDANAFARVFDEIDGASDRPRPASHASESHQQPFVSTAEVSSESGVTDSLNSSFPPGKSAGAKEEGGGTPAEVSAESTSPEGPPSTGLICEMTSSSDFPFSSDDAPSTPTAPQSSLEPQTNNLSAADVVVVSGHRALRISVRSTQLPQWQHSALLSKVRAELCWHGMSLAGLTVNGQVLHHAVVAVDPVPSNS